MLRVEAITHCPLIFIHTLSLMHVRSLLEVPVGPYMEVCDDESCYPSSGLPPPPASPAAHTYNRQGIDARPFARGPKPATANGDGTSTLKYMQNKRQSSQSSPSAPTNSVTSQDAQLNNIVQESSAHISSSSWHRQHRREQGDGTPAFFSGDEFDPEGHKLTEATTEVDQLHSMSQATKKKSVKEGTDAKASAAAAAAAGVNLKSGTVLNHPHAINGSGNTRKFSTFTPSSSIVNPPITSSTSSDSVAEQVANHSSPLNNLDFHPHPHTGYSFTSPQAPKNLNATQAPPTSNTSKTENTQHNQSSNTSTTNAASSNSNFTSHHSSSSASQAHHHRDHHVHHHHHHKHGHGSHRPLSLINLSQLPQAFSILESNLRQLRKALPVDEVVKNVQKNLPKGIPNVLEQTVGRVVSGVGAAVDAASGFKARSDRVGGGSSSSSSSAPSSSSISGRSSSASSYVPPPKSKPTKHELLSEILRVDHAGEYGAQRIYDGQLAVLSLKRAIQDTLNPQASQRNKKRVEESINTAAAATANAVNDIASTIVGSTADVSTSSSSSSSRAPGSSFSHSNDPISLICEMRSQEMDHLRTFNRMLPQYQIRPSVLLPVWDVLGFGLGAASALLGDRTAMACTVAVEEVITSHYNDQLRVLAHESFANETELKSVIKKHRDDEDDHRHVAVENEAEKAFAYQPISQVIKAGCHTAIWITKKL